MANERTNYAHIAKIDPDAHKWPPVPIDKHTDEIREQMGAWRWMGLKNHREFLLRLMHKARVMDFGGSAGPISNEAEIVDYAADAKAPYDLPGEFDLIFTSHTLEHIADIENCVRCLVDKLKLGGWLVAFVPGWKYEPWQAENYATHFQTFYLMQDEIPDGMDQIWTPIDKVLTDAGLFVAIDEWTDEECIILFARKIDTN